MLKYLNIQRLLVVVAIVLCVPLAAFAETKYGLKAGEKAPNINIKDVNGQIFDLNDSLKSGPVVVVFYRGGWCMYCNTQLRDLEAEVVPVTKKYNAKMIAISVDKMESAVKTKDEDKLSFHVASDPEAKTLGDYNVQYKMTDELVKKYLSYKVDIETASGMKHHIIAVPSVFVIDTAGTIVYSYANDDYKVRAKIVDVKRAIMQTASSSE